jgi:hypothetical protein
VSFVAGCTEKKLRWLDCPPQIWKLAVTTISESTKFSIKNYSTVIFQESVNGCNTSKARLPGLFYTGNQR